MDRESIVEVYTDGSVQPRNPGNGGSGSILVHEGHVVALGEYLGYNVTNNQAELHGIRIALQEVINLKKYKEKVILYSDSKYSLGVVGGQYLARKNQELVSSILSLRRKIPKLQLFWVRAHRKMAEAEDDKMKRLILWNDIADRVAKYSSKTKDYSWRESLSEEKFLKEHRRTL